MDGLSLEESLVALASIMRIGQVDPDTTFTEMGTDSLDAIEWIYRLLGSEGLSLDEEVTLLDGLWDRTPRQVHELLGQIRFAPEST